MNDRIQMPSALPAEVAESASDVYSAVLDDLADKLDAENEQAARNLAPVYVGQAEFWHDLFAEEVPEFIDQPLADCMNHLTAACGGSQSAIGAICTALSQIERQALPLAQRALKDIYDREGKGHEPCNEFLPWRGLAKEPK